jgi:hypothetical protein
MGRGEAYRLTHQHIHFPENGLPTVSESYSKWAPSLKGGVGVEFNRFKKVGFFVEMNIVVSFPEGAETAIHLPLTLDVTL